jgi:hypothetical protein
MVRYTVEQRVFLYDSYVKCGSARRCRRKFCRKYPGNTVPSTRGIHKLIDKVRSTGSLLDKKPARKRRVLTEEKLDEIGARLEHTPHKSLRCLAQEMGISKSSAATATKLLKLRPYEVTDPASTINSCSCRIGWCNLCMVGRYC